MNPHSLRNAIDATSQSRWLRKSLPIPVLEHIKRKLLICPPVHRLPVGEDIEKSNEDIQRREILLPFSTASRVALERGPQVWAESVEPHPWVCHVEITISPSLSWVKGQMSYRAESHTSKITWNDQVIIMFLNWELEERVTWDCHQVDWRSRILSELEWAGPVGGGVTVWEGGGVHVRTRGKTWWLLWQSILSVLKVITQSFCILCKLWDLLICTLMEQKKVSILAEVSVHFRG